ncbi:nuclear transport factor 2 family protein [Phyllobacterium zundukense]|jgi:ketosteroid isomerase-like protein|uniref:Nuclear transport factor 2 family protein n=1 Tax=Phyllobacterium zundukense TaxID=1867719 RepID=A0ACD4D8B5_9HYPH|nr:nuclear transport factor 2 family protein [Phyllobacterium zundukense]UXN62045.1 nuclear transport factor 2 family protein [Phyllobacterium zundukense]
MHLQHNPEILAFIDRLAETGSNYRMEEMESLYTEDLGFLVLTPEGAIARFSKEEIFAEFRSRRDAGEKPLSTAKKVLHIEEQGHEATAILYRQMGDRASPAFYELRLRRVAGEWRVAGETVLPWPDLATVKSFLPPREK